MCKNAYSIQEIKAFKSWYKDRTAEQSQAKYDPVKSRKLYLEKKKSYLI